MYGSTTAPPKIVTTASHTSGVPRPVASCSSLTIAATIHRQMPTRGLLYRATVKAMAAPARKCACLSSGTLFMDYSEVCAAMAAALTVAAVSTTPKS